MESSKSILDTVFILNQELFDKLSEEEYEILLPDLLTFWSDGNVDCVKFLSIVIWSAESDERKFLVEEEDYEPLEGFLRRKINKITSVIKKVEV